MRLRISITGRSYHATDGLPSELELPASSSLDDAVREISRLLPEGQSLPDSCLVILNDQHLGTLADHDTALLVDGTELVLLAPVAGG